MKGQPIGTIAWDLRALEECQSELQSEPTDLQNRSRLGVVHMLRGEFREALLQFDRVLEVDPTNLSLLSAVGQCLVELGRPEEAVARLMQAKSCNYTDPVAIFVLGQAQMSIGLKCDAISSFERVVHLYEPILARMPELNAADILVLSEARKLLTELK